MTRPRLAWPEYHADLAATAKHLLRQREDGYPRLVTAGKMKEAEAVERLELSRCLVAQWRWATDPSFPPLPDLPPYDSDRKGYFGAWARELAIEVAGIAATARSRVAAAPEDTDVAGLADLCDALAWYQQGEGSYQCRLTDDVVFYRDLNATLHRRARAGMLEMAA